MVLCTIDNLKINHYFTAAYAAERGNIMTVTQGILSWAIITSMIAGGIGSATPENPDGETDTPIVDSTADNLPDYDFSGKEFRIFNGAAQNESSFWNIDELTGDVLDDAIYHRNKAISERFNVKIVEQRLAEDASLDAAQYIMTTVLAGDPVSDIADIDIAASRNLATIGCLLNLYDVPYIDFDKDYWDIDLMNDLAFGDKLFYALSAANLDSYASTHLLAFNKDIEEKYGISKYSLNADSLYQLVPDGKWTLDNFYAASSIVAADINGDALMTEADQYGYLAGRSDMLAGMYIGAGLETISRADDGKFELAAGGLDRFSTLFDALKSNFVSNYFHYDDEKAALSEMFALGRGLFCDVTLGDLETMREIQFDFGFLPYPKLDETQPDYISRVESCNATIIPVYCMDIEFVGIMLEAFASQSYKETLPAYYDVAMIMKYTRDEPSSEMLDIVTGSRTFDLGDAVYGNLVRDKLCEGLYSSEIAKFEDLLAIYGEEVETYLGKVNDMIANMR